MLKTAIVVVSALVVTATLAHDVTTISPGCAGLAHKKNPDGSPERRS